MFSNFFQLFPYQKDDSYSIKETFPNQINQSNHFLGPSIQRSNVWRPHDLTLKVLVPIPVVVLNGLALAGAKGVGVVVGGKVREWQLYIWFILYMFTCLQYVSY